MAVPAEARSWPDWQRALSTHAEILALVSSQQGGKMMAAWADHRSSTHGRPASSPSVIALANSTEDMLAVEPLFVTEEMQELTYHAMETFDRTEPLHLDDLFLPSGFAVLEHPFYTVDIKNKRLCWRALSWRYVDAPTVALGEPVRGELEDAAGETRIVPALRMILWSHIDDPDDYPYDERTAEALRAAGARWQIAHATTIPFELVHDADRTSNDGDPRASWLTFFRVLQRLMAERIVVKEKRRVDRARWRDAKRRGLDIRDVVVVELRREARRAEGQGGTANYSHRFLRRGHWRLQPYPASGTHRQKWISLTVVGPEHLPLVVKDRVWVWDR